MDVNYFKVHVNDRWPYRPIYNYRSASVEPFTCWTIYDTVERTWIGLFHPHRHIVCPRYS